MLSAHLVVVVTVVVMTIMTTAVMVAVILDADIPTVMAFIAPNEHRVLVNFNTVTAATRNERAKGDQPAPE